MTTVTLPRRIIRPIATPPARRSLLLGFLTGLAAGLLVLTAISATVGITTGDVILGGVRVGGVELSGLDRDEARARLSDELPSLSAGQATVVTGDVESVVAYADVGRGYELDAMLDAAYGVGRDGNPVTDGIERLRSLVRPTELPVIVHAYDGPALAAVAAEIARATTTHPVEAHVDRDGFAVSESRDGLVVDAADVRSSLAAVLETSDPADVRVNVAAEVVPPIVTTEMAAAAAEMADRAVADLDLALPEGTEEDGEELGVSADTIASWITFGPVGENAYTFRLDEGAVSGAVAELAAEIDREPVDATFSVAGSGLGGVVPGVEGRELNIVETTGALVTAITERAAGTSVDSVTLAVDITEPSLTTAAAEEILPQMRMVSTWTTNYVVGEGNGFGNNISIPAWDLDGYNLAPGEWFSFWGGIGPVTVERGYRYGGAIINGRSVAQGALAGGICSTSTTLFNAAMRFGLEIGERTAHYYYIDRYPMGLDATVAIVDDSVVDMTFRNDTEYPIVIRGFGSPGQVTFQLWSVPNGRTVALSPPTTSNHRTAIETTQVDSSLAPGTSRRVEYPHNGFDSVVSRTVYGPDGEVIHQNTWFSAYRAVNGITLVGPTAAAEAEPPADQPADGAVAGDQPAPPGDQPAPPADEEPPAEG